MILRILTQEYLKEILNYDPETGVFTWLHPLGLNMKIGARAGGKTSHGYRIIGINKNQYKEHRLAWFYMQGEWPEYLDHINRIRNDNKINNLRESTRSENIVNSIPRKDNTSGYKGVTWQTDIKKWKAKAGNHYLGLFHNIEDAAKAYNQKALELFGEFSVLNRVN